MKIKIGGDIGKVINDFYYSSESDIEFFFKLMLLKSNIDVIMSEFNKPEIPEEIKLKKPFGKLLVINSADIEVNKESVKH